MKKSSFQKPLSKTRAQEILNAYGADPERWPEDERQSLIQLLAQSPEPTGIARDRRPPGWPA